MNIWQNYKQERRCLMHVCWPRQAAFTHEPHPLSSQNRIRLVQPLWHRSCLRGCFDRGSSDRSPSAVHTRSHNCNNSTRRRLLTHTHTHTVRLTDAVIVWQSAPTSTAYIRRRSRSACVSNCSATKSTQWNTPRRAITDCSAIASSGSQRKHTQRQLTNWCKI